MRRALLIAVASVGLMAAEPVPPPDRPLPDAAQEARAQALFEIVRCVVCQHESIADSPAGVAADMRRLVREQVAEGRTDQQVRGDLVRRYGDFVLFRPPFRLGTLLLWFGPALAALIAGVVLWRRSRRRQAPTTAPLSAEEEAILQSLTDPETIRPDTDANRPDERREGA